MLLKMAEKDVNFNSESGLENSFGEKKRQFFKEI